MNTQQLNTLLAGVAIGLAVAVAVVAVGAVATVLLLAASGGGMYILWRRAQQLELGTPDDEEGAADVQHA